MTGSEKISKISVKTRTVGWISNGNWISVKDGYLYLYYGKCRAYWVLNKIPKEERPVIRAIDRTKTIHINTYSVKFERGKDYELVKKCILGYSR